MKTSNDASAIQRAITHLDQALLMGGETFRVGLAALASSIHDRAFSDRSLLIKVRFVLPLSQIYIRMIFGWILALVRLRLNFPIPVH